jgi:predicted acyltransferase
VNALQPLFVFAIGIALALLVPRVTKESLAGVKMLQKGVGIGLIFVGGYLISR